jgi:hypothetical protein
MLVALRNLAILIVAITWIASRYLASRRLALNKTSRIALWVGAAFQFQRTV